MLNAIMGFLDSGLDSLALDNELGSEAEDVFVTCRRGHRWVTTGQLPTGIY